MAVTLRDFTEADLDALRIVWDLIQRGLLDDDTAIVLARSLGQSTARLADWQAEAGFYYYTTESYRDSNGNVQTRQVRHVRWEPASGSLAHFFDDELVPGTVGVHANLLRQVEPFPTTTDLKPYTPEFVRGWTVERYQLDLVAAAQRAKASASKWLMCVTGVCGSSGASPCSVNTVGSAWASSPRRQ